MLLVQHMSELVAWYVEALKKVIREHNFHQIDIPHPNPLSFVLSSLPHMMCLSHGRTYTLFFQVHFNLYLFVFIISLSVSFSLHHQYKKRVCSKKNKILYFFFSFVMSVFLELSPPPRIFQDGVKCD